MGAALKILLAGDVHIGRASTRLPPGLAAGRTRDAWTRLVDAAIDEQADVLCLSGDLADRDNRFWEALGPLEAGLRRLAEANVEVVAVAGNHDFDVLPRLADQVGGGLVLLGRGGAWERHPIRRNGRPPLDVVGWSFPREHVESSPLDDPIPVGDATRTLGLVHGDLGNPASPYAPLDADRLRAAGVDAWLLGHVHAPRLLDDRGPWLLYPGSPQAMDPGEPGLHGYWRTQLAEGRLATPTFAPLSDVVYDAIEIDLTGLDDAGAIDRRLLDSIDAHVARLAGRGGASLKAASLRLTLVGQTALAGEVEKRIAGLGENLVRSVGRVRVHVDRVTTATLPPIDLPALARGASGGSPPGLLAEVLLDLERDEPTLPATRALLDRVGGAIAQQDARRAFQPLAAADASASRAATAEAARSLLTRLMREAAR